MGQLVVEPTAIKGLWHVRVEVFPDPERAECEFAEMFRFDQLRDGGVALETLPMQCNRATSAPGTLRGIHVAPWYKYVFTVAGCARAVICDPRPQSPTFGQHVGFDLDGSNALFVSAGLGNSYQAMGEVPVTYCYLVDQTWAPGREWGIAWDDPTLDINWPIEAAQLSDKDKSNPTLLEAVK